METNDRLGIVVIGRNEGESLRACLQSIATATVVYVDSGSSDDSVELARSLEAHVVSLDGSRPFSAARARNEGFAKLRRLNPAVEFVQFIDGDCTLDGEWLDTASGFLEKNPSYAVACGHLRERNADQSLYNRLCEIEWHGIPGDVTSCGGIAMFSAAAFADAGGFDPDLIAGEEPELCVRLRQDAWKIRRLDEEMGTHDAAMTHFSQWWRRAVRGGFAFAAGAALHVRSPERHWLRETRSNYFWGLLLPLVIAGFAWPSGGMSLALLMAYPVLAARISRRMRARGFSFNHARLYAAACIVAKFAGMLGQARFHWSRLTARRPELIEYKGPEAART